ncbi:MAG: hypothetical protein WD200_05045 [Candidatus Andersenbacteria bacterium]
MSKITLLVGVAVLAALFFSGVIKIELQPDKLATVPGTVQNLVSDGGLLTSTKNKIISWKRKAELYLADSNTNKMELAMKYTEVDTQSLTELLDKKENPDVIISTAELLLGSVENMKEFAQQLSDEELVALQDQANLIVQKTSTVLSELEKIQKDYGEYEERLADITSSLQGSLGEPQQSEGEVAGSIDKQENSAPNLATPTPQIPLKF